ncbi:beta-1,3-galactosyltransferase 2-like [Scomber japonicus]|uniref:beta-1,3-galactosyltransferase 2-like n=1 Tax=Scomber japonicus TaxID=13676 RepID=UPI002305FF17|nr:beta-1,3-galactosyltransferase 2-like [Scomber japonicus]
MAHQGICPELAVCTTGPSAVSTGVTTLPRRHFLLSALVLKRALQAQLGFLKSILSASPLGSRRFLRLFTSGVQGITASHQQLPESPSRQTKPVFQSWFKGLILLCLLLYILYSTLFSSSLSWFKFPLPMTHFIRLNKPLPPYRVDQRLKQSNVINENTKLPSTIISSTPSTLYHQAYPRNYHFVMDNADVCKTKTPFLVLMVPVAPKNVEARDAIRQTWGNGSLVQGEVVLTLFMLGLAEGADVDQLQEKIKQENLQHHDLIQSDFMDTYLNLTIKTMVIMDWLATRCSTATYAMKIDSDMFLNIDNLVIMLKKPGLPKQNYLTGYLMWNRPVVRSKDSKWYVPVEMYPDPRYPTYTLGMGYVFSIDLPERFVEMSKSIKPFNIEDAYIGMCMKKLGQKPVSPPDPSQFKAYNSKYNRCEFSKIITYILANSQQLITYWTELKKPGPYC